MINLANEIVSKSKFGLIAAGNVLKLVFPTGKAHLFAEFLLVAADAVSAFTDNNDPALSKAMEAVITAANGVKNALKKQP